MRITEIRPRRKSLSAVYIDGEFAMTLDSRTLLENRFVAGREIDDDELREIIRLSNENRAKEKALWLISYRSHSKKELTDKIRRTCDSEAAEKAADRMEELGLINDRDYAVRLTEHLLFGKHMSKRAAFFELTRKGIDRETAEEILEETEYDPREQIEIFLSKKYKDLSDEKTRRRAFAALQRLGHGSDDIRAVLSLLEEEY